MVNSIEELEAQEPWGQYFVQRKSIYLVINSVYVIVKNLLNHKSDVAAKMNQMTAKVFDVIRESCKKSA